MKKIVAIALLLFPSLLFAQTYDWSAPVLNASYGGSVTVDTTGNVISMGIFIGTIDADPGPNVFNLASPNNNAVYIQKLDSNGNFLWAIALISNPLEYNHAYSLTTDVSGNVFFLGDFTGNVDFDPGPAINTLSAVNGHRDIFVLKLDPNGNFVWVKRFTGNTSENMSYCIRLIPSGGILVSGAFSGTMDFNPTGAVYNLTSAGYTDGFIVKLGNSGSFQWAKKVGAISFEDFHSFALDPSGNIIITGTYAGTVDFDPGTGIFNMTSALNQNGINTFDVFMLKLNAAGDFMWATTTGSYGIDEGFLVETDDAGNSYSVGVFWYTVDFDPGSGVNNLTETGGGGDYFIRKLDANGNFKWAKSLYTGSSGNEAHIESVFSDVNGTTFLTGVFWGTIDFDPGPGINNLTAAGDLFILNLDSGGNYISVTTISSTSGASGSAIFCDEANNIFLNGGFNGTVDMDPGAGIVNATATQGRFVLKLNHPVTCATCAVPTAITATNILSTKATINWTGNSCAVKYRVQIRVQGTTSWSTLTVTAPATTKFITGLTGNTIYEYRVRTDCNAAGTFASAYSPVQTFTTPCVCSKPTGITVTNLTQTSAKINWLGNTCAVKYRLQIRVQGTTAWSTIIVTAPTAFKTVTGLTHNTIYEYRLRSDCDATGTVNSGWTTITTFATPLRLEDETVTVTNTMTVLPNPCTTCEIITTGNANDLLVTDILGRKLNATFSQSINGFYINLPETSTGIFFIRNTRTDEVVKFVRE